MLQAGHQGVETSYSVNRTLLKHLCTWYNPYKNLWLQYACCICAAVSAAHMQVAYMCRICMSTCTQHVSRKAQIGLVCTKIFCICAAHICLYVDMCHLNAAR